MATKGSVRFADIENCNGENMVPLLLQRPSSANESVCEMSFRSSPGNTSFQVTRVQLAGRTPHSKKTTSTNIMNLLDPAAFLAENNSCKSSDLSLSMSKTKGSNTNALRALKDITNGTIEANTSPFKPISPLKKTVEENYDEDDNGDDDLSPVDNHSVVGNLCTTDSPSLALGSSPDSDLPTNIRAFNVAQEPNILGSAKNGRKVLPAVSTPYASKPNLSKCSDSANSSDKSTISSAENSINTNFLIDNNQSTMSPSALFDRSEASIFGLREPSSDHSNVNIISMTSSSPTEEVKENTSEKSVSIEKSIDDTNTQAFQMIEVAKSFDPFAVKQGGVALGRGPASRKVQRVIPKVEEKVVNKVPSELLNVMALGEPATSKPLPKAERKVIVDQDLMDNVSKENIAVEKIKAIVNQETHPTTHESFAQIKHSECKSKEPELGAFTKSDLNSSSVLHSPPLNIGYTNSPMFCSYRKYSHESDSDDDMELGLEQLIWNEFDDRYCRTSAGSSYKMFTTESPKIQRSDAIIPDSCIFSNKSTSLLGSAQRVPTPSSAVDFFAESYESDEETMPQRPAFDVQSTTLKPSSNSRTSTTPMTVHTTNATCPNTSLGSASIGGSTFVTEHAVANSFWVDEDDNISCANDKSADLGELLNELENNTSYLSEDASVEDNDANTTITLDRFNDSFAEDKSIHPKMIVGKKSRQQDFLPDIKEICFNCLPGETTTVKIVFDNRKSSLITLESQPIQVRFEKRSMNNHGKDIIVTDEYISAHFTCFDAYPRMLGILPSQKRELEISFSPVEKIEGVYSGVLKIKNGKRSFLLLLRGESFFDKADTVSVKEHETSAATDLKKQNHEHNQLIIANQNAIGQTTYLLNENVSKSCTIKEKLPVIHEASETISMSAEESKNDSFHEKQLSLKKRIESIAHNGKANSMDKTSSISSLISAINNSNSSGQRFHGHLSGDNIGRATVEHDFFSRTPSTVNKSSCSMLSNVQRKNDDSSYSEKKTPCIPNDSRLSTTISPDEWRKLYNTLSSNYKSETKRANFEHSPINSISKKEISSVPSALQTPPNHLIRQQRGVFFRRSSAHFGAVAIGSLSRTKLELCNATNEEVTVFLSDPALPFVLLHNEVRLRPRSYVRIPVRFLPIHSREFVTELVAQTEDGNYHSTIILTGTAHF